MVGPGKSKNKNENSLFFLLFSVNNNSAVSMAAGSLKKLHGESRFGISPWG
jgi:hypothetical protein